MTTPVAIFLVCLIIAYAILHRDVERLRRRVLDLSESVYDLVDRQESDDDSAGADDESE